MQAEDAHGVPKGNMQVGGPVPFLREIAGYGWPCPPCRRKEQAKGLCGLPEDEGQVEDAHVLSALSEGEMCWGPCALPAGERSRLWVTVCLS